MIGSGQSIERQHSEYSRQTGAENRQLKSNGDEIRPAIVRLASDVQGIADNVRPVLEEEAPKTSDESAHQAEERDARAAKTHRIRQPLDGKRRERIQPA